jgi:RND family efflux transporter MFP subunit
MSIATCPSREELIDYVVGKLPDEASNTLANHLDTCPDCQAELATLPEPNDTLIARLRGPVPSDPFLEEPGCGQAMARAMAVVGKDGSTTDLPRQLGEYQLIQRIGSGGMGTVYKARQGRLDRIVALKILSRGRTDDPRAIVRFEREMRAIGQLDHPNIVRAYDAREIDNTRVLIMEFVDGLDLAEIARCSGPVTVPDACELIRQTALALQCAHDHGLVHRDIKPSNIMLARSGEVKLLDLGLARFYSEGAAQVGRGSPDPAQSAVGRGSPDRAQSVNRMSPDCGRPSVGAVARSETGHNRVETGHNRVETGHNRVEETTGTGQAMGTADYMAPEQASDSRTVDIRADIYGLGCTLYKLLTGRAPFSGPEYRTTLDKMNAHVHQPAPPVRPFVPEAPEGLCTVIDRMLAKDPDDRYRTPAEVVEALTPWCAGADLPALLASAISPPLPPGEGWGEGSNSPARQAEPAARPPLLLTSWGWKWFAGQLLLLMMAGGLGFALGIIIRIHKDGQVTTVEVPERSKTRIGADGQVEVELPGGEKSDTAAMLLRSFTTADATISKDVSKADGIWFVKCDNRAITQPICLFEVPTPNTDDCTVIYRAKLKSGGLKGRAYLEMWCRFPGQGEFFSRGLDHVLSGNADWSSYETPFFLKKGEKPDLIRLNLAVEGSGNIGIKDVELIKTPFPASTEPVAATDPFVPKPFKSNRPVASATDEGHALADLPAAVPPAVSVSRPVVREVSDYEDYPGRIEKSVETPISAKGVIAKLYFKPGMIVKQGEVLAETVAEEDWDKIQRAQSDVDQSARDLEEVNKLPSPLSPEDSKSKAEFEERLKKAREKLDVARRNVKYEKILAPCSGKIRDTNMPVRIQVGASGGFGRGGFSQPGKPWNLGWITSLDSMYATFDVDERTVLAHRRMANRKPDWELSLPVLWGLADNKDYPYRGKVVGVDNEIDPKTGTQRWHVLLPNKEGILLPGMFVRVRLITSAPHKALLIPERALGMDQGLPFVFVVNDQDLVERRAVKIGQVDDGLRSVTEGLKAEDRVITSGLQKVRPGMGMTVKPEKAY